MLWYRTKSWNKRLAGDLSTDFEYRTVRVLWSVELWTTAKQPEHIQRHHYLNVTMNNFKYCTLMTTR